MKYLSAYTFYSLTLGTTANKKTSIITNPEVLNPPPAQLVQDAQDHQVLKTSASKRASLTNQFDRSGGRNPRVTLEFQRRNAVHPDPHRNITCIQGKVQYRKSGIILVSLNQVLTEQTKPCTVRDGREVRNRYRWVANELFMRHPSCYLRRVSHPPVPTTFEDLMQQIPLRGTTNSHRFIQPYERVLQWRLRTTQITVDMFLCITALAVSDCWFVP